MTELQQELYDILCEFDRICSIFNIKYTLAYGTLLGAVRHEGFIPWDDDLDVIMLRDDYEKLVEKINIELNDDYFFQTQETEAEYFRPFAKIRSNKKTLIEKNSSHLTINHGVWLDIFILDKVSEDKNLFEEQFKHGEKYNNIIRNKIYMHSNNHDSMHKRIIKNLIALRNRLFKDHNLKLAREAYWKRDKAIKRFNNKRSNYVFNFEYLDHYERIKNHVFRIEDFQQTTQLLFVDKLFPVPVNYDGILERYYGDYMKLPDEVDRISHT